MPSSNPQALFGQTVQGTGYLGDTHSEMHGRTLGLVENVKAYGAVGDGVTDDILAIEAARDALGTDGGKVFFPPGDYQVSRTIFDSTTAAAPIVFQGSGAGDRPKLKSATRIKGSGITIMELRTQGSGVEDLAIYDSVGNASTIGLRLGNTDGTDYGWGLGTISNVQVEGTSTNGTGIKLDWGLEALMTNVTIVKWSVGVYNYGLNASLASNANAWVGCKFRENLTGIKNEGSSLYLFGCTNEGNEQFGVDNVSGGMNIFGTHFENNAGAVNVNLTEGTFISQGNVYSSADPNEDVVSAGVGRSMSIFDNMPSGITHTGSDIFTIVHPTYMPNEPVGAGQTVVHRALSVTSRNLSSNDWTISGIRGVIVPSLTNNGTLTMNNDASLAQSITAGTVNGLKIGTGSTQKLGFFNTTPVAQQAANPDTSGAILADLETEVNQLKAALRSLGLIAT